MFKVHLQFFYHEETIQLRKMTLRVKAESAEIALKEVLSSDLIRDLATNGIVVSNFSVKF